MDTEGGVLNTGVYSGERGGPVGGGGGEGLPGEKYQMWMKVKKQTKHTAMCVPMQLYCMLCTCIPKPKMQLKKKKNLETTDAGEDVEKKEHFYTVDGSVN